MSAYRGDNFGGRSFPYIETEKADLFDDPSNLKLIARIARLNGHLSPYIVDRAARKNPKYSPEVLNRLGAESRLDSLPYHQSDSSGSPDYRFALKHISDLGMHLPDFTDFSEEQMERLFGAARDYISHRIRFLGST